MNYSIEETFKQLSEDKLEKWEKKVNEMGFALLKMENQIDDMIKEGKKVGGELEVISALYNTKKKITEAKKELEDTMF
jgi:muramoyltetrapeptide carboxypeptidase LdcA involved in peptidoglycan recycling